MPPTTATWLRGHGRWPFLLLGALATVSFVAATASAGGPTEYQTGDVHVTSGTPVVWENRTVVLTGNVTVDAGGTFRLVNSTLLLALAANGSYAVTVEGGGTFEVLDLDGAASTPADRSSVASATAGLRYTLTFQAGSNVLVRASEVRDFGYSALVPGMTIRSSNVTFEGATIGAYAFLKVEGASPRFAGTTFDGGGQGSNYFYASDAVVEACTLTGHLVAVAALQGSSLAVTGSLMRDLVFALAVNGSTVAVANSTLINSTQGVYLTNGSQATLTDVDLGGAPVAFGDGASGLAFFRSFRAFVLNQALEPVRLASIEFRAGGGGVVASGTTGNQGLFGPVALLAYNESQAGQTVASNYTVNATRGQNTTEVGFSALTESGQLTLSITANLDPRVVLLRPAPGAVLLADVVATFEVSVQDPDMTPGGLTVTWRESTLGLLGTGTTALISLPLGNWSLTVEAADADGGLRSLPFSLSAVGPTVQTFTDGGDPGRVSFEVSKTPTGGFLVTASYGTPPALLGVGPAFDIRPATGTVVWSNGTLTMSYDPGDLPYGVNRTLLAIARYNGTTWLVVPGTVHNETLHTVRAAVTPASGLGSFTVVALAPATEPPQIDPVPRLVAVRGVPFSYPLVARDTPGQQLTFSLSGAPSWLRVDGETGLLTGTAAEESRGLLNFTVVVTDDTFQSSNITVEVFVTASASNTAPQLVNPTITPAEPRAGQEVAVQVTYFDAEDDPPVVVELLVDGSPVQMEPVDARDIYYLDGKAYVARVTLSAGTHNLSVRTTDGGPGHADVVLALPEVSAKSTALDAVNNMFLALFVSAALTLVFIVYLASRKQEPRPGGKEAAAEPEDRVEFLEGPTLGRIEPQAPSKAGGGPSAEQDALESEAEDAGRKAAKVAQEIEDELGRKG